MGIQTYTIPQIDGVRVLFLTDEDYDLVCRDSTMVDVVSPIGILEKIDKGPWKGAQNWLWNTDSKSLRQDCRDIYEHDCFDPYYD